MQLLDIWVGCLDPVSSEAQLVTQPRKCLGKEGSELISVHEDLWQNLELDVFPQRFDGIQCR